MSLPMMERMMLIDHTRENERDVERRMTNNVSCRVIYMTKDGLDYCRDNLGWLPWNTSHDDAAKEAQEWFAKEANALARRAVTGFRVEWW